MKCPNCGHWNRASFPRCFRCGEPLPQEGKTAREPASRRPDLPADGPSRIYIQINEEGKATPAVDERDRLAREMETLVERKRRGEKEHQRLQENSAAQGFAPSGRSVQTLTGRRPFPIPQSTSYSTSTEEREIEGDVRPDAIPVVSQRIIGDDDEMNRPYARTENLSKGRKTGGRRVKMYRHGGLHRAGRLLLLLFIAAAVLLAGYQWVYKPLVLDRRTLPLQERALITPSILNDLPAHTIRLPGEEGQSIWIKELKKSYPVVGGYATFEVADYIWYEDSGKVTQETATAVITPYLKTKAGEQRQMEQITYEVDVPLSPLTLVNPSDGYAEVSTALYNIQFEVARNSTVIINGEDYSDLVNTQDGLISYNATVSPIGENRFTITTRAQYYRENSVTVTIYRAAQQIRLDLAADIATRFSPTPETDPATGQLYEPYMTVKGTTVSWATIKVLTSHVNLDTTQMAVNGTFSFQAVFDKIGYNTIIIEASAPGYETSVVEHQVYYVPVAAIYTRKAWDMNTQYTDYLNNSERRIDNTQIYVCRGEIVEILSDRPQMAIMKLDSDYDRTVLIRNYSNDNWRVGMKGRVYADAYGLYNGSPWLNGRYSYLSSGE